MQVRIESLLPKQLIALHTQTSFADNKTILLWHHFMSRRKEISDIIATDLYSIQTYPPLFFQNFNPHQLYDKWAAVEVSEIGNIPIGMEAFVLNGGLYAVFSYKGDNSGAKAAFEYIFTEWLPQSGYSLDDRPHFEKLGEKYKNNDPNSEEEIWIPIN